MFMFRGALVGLLTGGCLALGAPVFAQQAPPRSADAIVLSVKVHSTKKGGDAWDLFGGAPDLMVFLRKTEKGGAKHSTKVKKDSFEASFAERTVRVSVGDECEVIVYDKDEEFDNKIGQKKFKITEKMLNKREVKWEFDRVISLVLEFEP